MRAGERKNGRLCRDQQHQDRRAADPGPDRGHRNLRGDRRGGHRRQPLRVRGLRPGRFDPSGRRAQPRVLLPAGELRGRRGQRGRNRHREGAGNGGLQRRGGCDPQRCGPCDRHGRDRRSEP